MVQLKQMQTTNEQTPNLTVGMKFAKITSAKTVQTRYKKRDGTTQDNVTIEAVRVGDTAPTKYHSTASAIVDLLKKHFETDKSTEAIENAEVVEIRSKDGRNYLTLRGF